MKKKQSNFAKAYLNATIFDGVASDRRLSYNSVGREKATKEIKDNKKYGIDLLFAKIREVLLREYGVL
ncbi:hypothetical protein NYE67_04040 [Solibacillus sp. FSL W8-0474]|uniref:hypothetical protein n=1 Tax=Solibacillus sp. FSL W8-0474 TaxID=2975336 RepID=UPI0030F5748C